MPTTIDRYHRAEAIRKDKDRYNFYERIGAKVLPTTDYSPSNWVDASAVAGKSMNTARLELTDKITEYIRGLAAVLRDPTTLGDEQAVLYEMILSADQKRPSGADRCEDQLQGLVSKLVRAGGTVLRVTNIGSMGEVKLAPFSIDVEDLDTLLTYVVETLDMSTEREDFKNPDSGWALSPESGVFLRVLDVPGFDLGTDENGLLRIHTPHGRSSEWLSPCGWGGATPLNTWGLIYGIDSIVSWVRRNNPVDHDELKRISDVPGFEPLASVGV